MKRKMFAPKVVYSLVSIVALLGGCLPSSLRANDTNAKSNSSPFGFPRPAVSVNQRDTDLTIARQRDFTRSRDLLRQQAVPFEPDDLLERGWRKTLSAAFTEMPEMQMDREVTSTRIAGVYIANRLTLPEKLTADSDVVILARHLVYSGRHVEIIAPGHDVSVFVIDSEEKRPVPGAQGEARNATPTVYVRTGGIGRSLEKPSGRIGTITPDSSVNES